MRERFSFHSSMAATEASARWIVRRSLIRGERVRPLVTSTGSVGGIECSCFPELLLIFLQRRVGGEWSAELWSVRSTTSWETASESWPMLDNGSAFHRIKRLTSST
uniref:Uncharacterized protein n=1 Tax=Opuntia streptacantha TaxID=393608 RepID=A0A7C9CW49_OPUST